MTFKALVKHKHPIFVAIFNAQCKKKKMEEDQSSTKRIVTTRGAQRAKKHVTMCGDIVTTTERKMGKEKSSTERIVTKDKGKAQSADDEGSLSLESRGNLRESERMLFFTDAAVAIAATLMVLPLMEAAAELSSGETGEETAEETGEYEEEVAVVKTFYQENGVKIGFYALSFYVVFSLWTRHVFLFAYVDKIVSNALVLSNGLWIFTIVLMPLAVTFVSKLSGFCWLFYFGVVQANSIVNLAMVLIIRRNPETRMVQEHGPTTYCVIRQVSFIFWCAVAMVVGALLEADLGSLGFVPLAFGPQLTGVILERYFDLNMEQSPVDEVSAFYAKHGFVSATVGFFLKAVGLRGIKKHFDLGHREIFSRISERLIILTDAIVAISMTLLIVPLSERSQEFSGSNVSEFILDQGFLLLAFSLSFTVVFLYWKLHDSMYAHQDGKVHPLFFVYSLPWLMTIAYVPVASALIDAENVSGSTSWRAAQFFLTLLLNRLVAAILSFIVFQDSVDVPPEFVLPHVIAVLLGGLAVGLSFVVPYEWTGFLILLFYGYHSFTRLLVKIWPGLPALMTDKIGRNNEKQRESEIHL